MKNLPTLKVIKELFKRDTEVSIKDFFVLSIYGSLFLSILYFFLPSLILLSLDPAVSKDLSFLTLFDTGKKIYIWIKLLIFNFFVFIFSCYLFFSSYWLSPRYFRVLTIFYPVVFLLLTFEVYPNSELIPLEYELDLYFIFTVTSIISYEHVRDFFLKFLFYLTDFYIGLFLTSIVIFLHGFIQLLILYIVGNDKKIN